MPIGRRPAPLSDVIRGAIRDSGQETISFCEYMDLCLYHPLFGYYPSSRPKVGRDGDFYTSTNIGGIMGEMIARYFLALFGEGLPRYRIVEWGGGTGAMARQVLDSVQQLSPGIYANLEYALVERSGYHRQSQAEALREHEGTAVWWTETEWLAERSDTPALIFANEVLDAFPVHRVRCRNGVLHEIHVSWNEAANAFEETERPCSDADVVFYLQQERVHLTEGQTIEVNLGAGRWISGNLEWLAQGALLTIDYGDTAEEIHSRHRMNGTLMCYREHRAHDDPYLYPGEQDITSHVNFSACIRAGESAGCRDAKLLTQKRFLLEAGILELLQDHASPDPFSTEARRNRAIRQLLLSDGMSELFKVLIQTKGTTQA